MAFRENLNDQTILVCGGAGFIGSNFIRYIVSRYPHLNIINFDKLTYAGNLENLKDISIKGRYRFLKGDISSKSSMERIFKRYLPVYVINFAAETHVDQSIHRETSLFLKTNVSGVFSLLENIKKFGGVKKFVQVSTDEVYGSLNLQSKERFNENSPLWPNNPYSASKASGDLLCRSYFQTFRTPVVVTRCCNNYGPYQYPEKLVPFFWFRCKQNKKLPLYGDGKNVRDWIYVLDHCSALELCLLKGKPGEVYNISSNNERSNFDIANMVLGYFNKDHSYIEYVNDRPGHDRKYAINSDKIRKELGWRPTSSFNKSFIRTVGWYDKNQEWVEKVCRKPKELNSHIV